MKQGFLSLSSYWLLLLFHCTYLAISSVYSLHSHLAMCCVFSCMGSPLSFFAFRWAPVDSRVWPLCLASFGFFPQGRIENVPFVFAPCARNFGWILRSCTDSRDEMSSHDSRNPLEKGMQRWLLFKHFFFLKGVLFRAVASSTPKRRESLEVYRTNEDDVTPSRRHIFFAIGQRWAILVKIKVAPTCSVLF